MAWVSSPAFLQTQKYPSLRDRVILGDMGVQRGVWDDGDFLVGATTGLVLFVAPGDIMVKASHPSLANRGLYHVQASASETVTIPTANGSNPRLDQVIVTVKDPSYDPALVSSTPVLSVVQGTATAGATLNNRLGAVADSSLPPSSQRIADVLVPTGATQILTTNIRDRRPMARGQFKRATYTGGNLSTTSTALVAITQLLIRAEITGDNPVEIMFSGTAWATNLNASVRATASYFKSTDGTTDVPLMGTPGGYFAHSSWESNFLWSWTGYPPADMIGSSQFFPKYSPYEGGVPVGYSAFIAARTDMPLFFTVREILHGIQPTFPTS